MGSARTVTASAVLATATAMMIGGCSSGVDRSAGSGRPVLDLSHPTYSSIQDLASASDVVVRGRIGPLVARVVDDGGESQQGTPAGVPMAFYSFSVDQVLRGQVPSRKVTVGVIDLNAVRYEDSTAIAAGAPVLLFLKLRPAAQHPYMTAVPGPFYVVTTSSDNGVLDVSGNQVQARSLQLRSVARTGTPAIDGARLFAPLTVVEGIVGKAPTAVPSQSP